MYELTHALAALLSVGFRRVGGYVRKISVCLECQHFRRFLAVLPAMALHAFRSIVFGSPIMRNRLVGIVYQYAVVGDGLGIVVPEVVIRAVSAASGIQRQKIAFVYREVVFVVLLVMAEFRTGRESAIRGILLPAGTQKELSESLEMTGMERYGFKLLIGVRLHAITVEVQDERIQREVSGADIPVRSAFPEICGKTGRLRIDLAEEMDVLRHVREQRPHGKQILVVAFVAETGIAGTVRRLYPCPVYPVREKRESGMFRGNVFAERRQMRMEEVEMRVGIHAHAVARRGRAKSTVVPCAFFAEIDKLEEFPAPFRQMQFRQFVAEPVSVGGKPRIPLQRPHSIIAFVVCGIVSANDMLLPAFRVRLLDMRHKRNDDVPAFLGSQRLPYPVVGAEPHNARIRVPAYRLAVAVGLVIGGDAHRQHALCLFEISPFLRKPPCERAFRRLGPPIFHLLYRRKA